jgi:hypothetical protein
VHVRAGDLHVPQRRRLEVSEVLRVPRLEKVAREKRTDLDLPFSQGCDRSTRIAIADSGQLR